MRAMCRLPGKDRASRLVACFIVLVQRRGCPVTLSCSIGKAVYLASDLPATRQRSSFALSGIFYWVSAAVRMSRYPLLLYRQGRIPCFRSAGIAACSPASGLLRRPYPLACRSPLAGDVPATRQGSSFALSGMFYCVSSAVRMSRYPFPVTLSCSIGKALYLASDLPASRPVRPQAGSYVGRSR